MKTYPKLSFGLYVAETKMDADISTVSDLQPFSDVDNLETDNVMIYPYVTYEPDYFLLDGAFKFIPEDYSNTRVGMFSLDQSDSIGDFSTPPVLTIEFTNKHDTDGIGLRFSLNTGDYADEIQVKYYEDTSLISDETYYPDSVEFSAEKTVNDFNKIVITFVSTNNPYRYLRVQGIDFGKLVTFTGEDIKQAEVTEEISMLSTEIKVNSMDITIFSEDDDFSILNPDGYYVALKERQPVAAYVYSGETVEFIGQYYLDTWENSSENIIKFYCVDMLGTLDTIPFKGAMLSAETTSDYIDDIMSDNNIPYELDATLAAEELTGWIPPGTLRDALQQIAFALGAYVDCSRAWSVKIHKSKLAVDEAASVVIADEEQGISRSVTLKPLVTRVEVSGHKFNELNDESELFNGSLAAGTHEIIFLSPMHDLSATGASIASSGSNYAILTVASAGTVTLTGKTYADTVAKHGIDTSGLGASVKPNVVEITDAYLINPDNLEETATRIHDYYSQRYIQKVKLYSPTIMLGDIVDFETLYGRTLRAGIEKIGLNLAGGFVGDIEVFGVDYVA